MDQQKVMLGRVDIPPEHTKSMKYVAKDGTVWAAPRGGRKYTDAQRKNVEEATKKARAVFVSKGKKLRDEKNDAWKELKKAPMSDKLRNAFTNAEEALAEFDKGRKAAEAKATKEAREKALK